MLVRTMQPSKETYLGDGLYVSIEWGMIKLRAPREDGDHWVALEATTLENFLTWLKELRERAQKEGRGAIT